MLAKILFRTAFTALALYTCGVTLVLSYKVDELEREKDGVVRGVQVLDLAKYWLRGKTIDAGVLPPGYGLVPIDDPVPHWRTDAKTLFLFTRPAPAPPNSSPRVQRVVRLELDQQGRFVDLKWGTP